MVKKTTQTREAVTLIGRLIARLTRAARPRDEAQQGDRLPHDLQPPGRRSGQGIQSIAAYLEEGRSSRPGPLE